MRLHFELSNETTEKHWHHKTLLRFEELLAITALALNDFRVLLLREDVFLILRPG